MASAPATDTQVLVSGGEYRRLIDSAALFDWPWPCHRDGHVWVMGLERCQQCGVPYAVDDVEDIILCGKMKYESQRREELGR